MSLLSFFSFNSFVSSPGLGGGISSEGFLTPIMLAPSWSTSCLDFQLEIIFRIISQPVDKVSGRSRKYPRPPQTSLPFGKDKYSDPLLLASLYLLFIILSFVPRLLSLQILKLIKILRLFNYERIFTEEALR